MRRRTAPGRVTATRTCGYVGRGTVRNPSAARISISTPRAGASLTKASIERTTPLTCGSQASVMMRMRVNGEVALSSLDVQGLREIAMVVWRPARVTAAHDGNTFNRCSSFFTAVAGEKVSSTDENY